MARQRAAPDRWGSARCVRQCVLGSLDLQSSSPSENSLLQLPSLAQAHKEHVLHRVWRLFLLYLSKMKVHTWAQRVGISICNSLYVRRSTSAELPGRRGHAFARPAGA